MACFLYGLEMPDLICEIWRDDDTGSFEAGQVSENHDQLRKAVSPNSVLLHTYTARSNFEIFQKNCDWHGWDRWNPPEGEGVSEYFFTEAEVEEQRRYLATRQVS
jgi:hypothetical protein